MKDTWRTACMKMVMALVVWLFMILMMLGAMVLWK